MNKQDFLLKVEDFSTSGTPWKREMHDEHGVSVGIEVHVKASPGRLWDNEFATEFDEFDELEIMDEMDGLMTYYGEMSKQQICDALVSSGFDAVVVP